MPRSLKINFIFVIYWMMLLYILAALVWWYIALERQNNEMALLRISELRTEQPAYETGYNLIIKEKQRKSTQYIGEGLIFLLLVVAAAIYIYRAVNRELKQSREQQNFMIAITHELKTPISVSKLNLETMQKRKLDETQQQRLIQSSLEETNRLNMLCNNLLISSQLEGRVHRFTPENIDFSAMLNQVVQDYKSRYPERKFQEVIQPGLSLIGDSFMLQMLFSNLMDNACKYSPKDKSVELSAGLIEEEIFVRVADQGTGIPAEERVNVFKKFYRIGNEATRKSKGTGLGLYLVKRLLNVHRASIFIEANQPRGTIFETRFKKL